MNDDIPIGTGGVHQHEGPVPRTIKDAFNLWFDECGSKMLDAPTPAGIEKARAAMFAVFLAGVGWATTVPPNTSVYEYFSYRRRYEENEDSDIRLE